MLLRCWLALLVALIPAALSTNPGVKIKLTQEGLEYGKLLGMPALQARLKSIRVPDIPVSKCILSSYGTILYKYTNMQITSVGLPMSEVVLVQGSAVKLSINNAYISLNGNWWTKYFLFGYSGSFDLNVSGLTITTNIAVKSDKRGRPAVSSFNCAASVGSTKIDFHGGISWMYDVFNTCVDQVLRLTLEQQICSVVAEAVSDLNPHLETLNVVAKVDQYAEIEYSMVSSPIVWSSYIDLSLKGEFYNIGWHQEPPFSPKAFSLPAQINNMLYIGVSEFTANSAAFVYNKAGVLSLYITDDMIPEGSLFRLNTKIVGILIPQIAQKFPDLMMKLLVKTAKNPVFTFEPDNMIVQTTATVKAYAIQPNSTLSPLFVLNVDSSVSANVFVSGMRLAGSVTLNKMTLTLGTSYVGQIQVCCLNNMFQMLLKDVVIPKLNAQLGKGFPLPALGNMKLVHTQLQVLKDYVLIGTDVQFMRRAVFPRAG